MKITKQQLKQIIEEEIQAVLEEGLDEDLLEEVLNDPREVVMCQEFLERDQIDLEEKKKGLEAKAFTKEILESNKGKFDIISHGVGKYGRVLGELFVKGHDKSLNELLKDNGHAYEYHGEKKKKFDG